MFYEAAKCRKIIYEKHKHIPLDLKEVFAATRINLRYDKKLKIFKPVQRPYRKYWIILLESMGIKCPKWVARLNPVKY